MGCNDGCTLVDVFYTALLLSPRDTERRINLVFSIHKRSLMIRDAGT